MACCCMGFIFRIGCNILTSLGMLSVATSMDLQLAGHGTVVNRLQERFTQKDFFARRPFSNGLNLKRYESVACVLCSG